VPGIGVDGRRGPNRRPACPERRCARACCVIFLLALSMSGEHRAGAREIVRSIDTERDGVNAGHVDAHAVLQRAQLLEALALLEGPARQRHEALERRAAIGVEPDMVVVRPGTRRDGRAARNTARGRSARRPRPGGRRRPRSSPPAGRPDPPRARSRRRWCRYRFRARPEAVPGSPARSPVRSSAGRPARLTTTS